jgi:cell division septation protein DedD
MSRDVKRRQSAPESGGRRGGTLVGIFVGLVLGVCIAAGVAWYTSRSATPFVDKKVVRDKPAETVGGAASSSGQPMTPPAGAPPAPPAPVALAGKPGDPPPNERRFQFYDILQGKSEPVPSKDAKPTKPEATAPDMKPSAQAMYLQAGAFSKVSDAENLKASLAMQGVETVVQQVMIQDKTLYRVRLGPYARPEDANQVKQELAKSGIEVTAVK